MSHDLSHFHLQLLRFQINPLSYIPLSVNSLHSHLHLLFFQRFYYYKHLHLIYVCIYTFHAIRIFLASLVLEISLNTLIFMFLTIPATHKCAYELLLLLKLPLHLVISKQQDKMKVYYC